MFRSPNSWFIIDFENPGELFPDTLRDFQESQRMVLGNRISKVNLSQRGKSGSEGVDVFEFEDGTELHLKLQKYPSVYWAFNEVLESEVKPGINVFDIENGSGPKSKLIKNFLWVF